MIVFISKYNLSLD